MYNKKSFQIILIVLLYTFSFLLATAKHAHAYVPQGKVNVQVYAQVGQYYISISGFVSPYASVVLSSDNQFIASTVADSNGNFYFSQLLIKAGFSHFCLDAVDFKRIGESYTCITFPPATGSLTKDKIFLPPTIGLSKTSIAAGEKTYAFGYTMPGAQVSLHLSNGKILTVLADSSGYYIFTIDNLPAGAYSLYATAIYQNQESLSPTKKLELHSLSLWERIIAFLKDLFNKFVRLFTSISIGILWLAIPILILIIILILKTWPERFTWITGRFPKFTIHKKIVHHLHHYWEFQE